MKTTRAYTDAFSQLSQSDRLRIRSNNRNRAYKTGHGN